MNENSQAILLLTVRFGASKSDTAPPLSPAEYGNLASWLYRHEHEPRALLRDPEKALEDWCDPRGKLTVGRIKELLNRSMAMGVALEKWQSAGLWVITRADGDYPDRLRKQLGLVAPAVLFGAGNVGLLNSGGLAMVGSRDITDADRRFSEVVARQAAHEGLNIVSGGARGVDQAAMVSALEVNGTAVGILAGGLLRAALSLKWRTTIKSKQLCLVSPFNPEAGFQVGNAMARNKYIYCLSDFALVVQSAKKKGGTWAGATENLKHHWTKLLVRSDRQSPGLQALARFGAAPLSLPQEDARTGEWLREALSSSGVSERKYQAANRRARMEFYWVFLDFVGRLLSEREEVTLGELRQELVDLRQSQIIDWLERAVSERHLERVSRNHVYRVPLRVEGCQMPLFESVEDGSRKGV